MAVPLDFSLKVSSQKRFSYRNRRIYEFWESQNGL